MKQLINELKSCKERSAEIRNTDFNGFEMPLYVFDELRYYEKRAKEIEMEILRKIKPRFPILDLETDQKDICLEILNNFNNAMSLGYTNNEMLEYLKQNLRGYLVGRGGSHIYISDKNNGHRYAIISNIF